MSTTKSIKIQKNKILTYSINKTDFQTVNKSIVVTEDMTINENMVSQSGSQLLQLGDRLFGISSFVCYFTPSGTYDVDSLKFIYGKQTTGNGLTNIQVVKSLWIAQIETALSVETPKGSSKDFVFTFNGSTWDLTGATTVSGISQTDLSDVYGITFTGTASSGNVITVTETHYNKFACYVLDANYRNNQKWANNTVGRILIMPKQYSSNPQDCIESATYYNDYIKNHANLDDYPIFNYCKNLGRFIMPNNMVINPVVPNGAELLAIWNNKTTLDSFDPVIQGGSTSFNLTNWNFNNATSSAKGAWSCIESTVYTYQGDNRYSSWCLLSTGSWIREAYYTDAYGNKSDNIGCIPVFEVPVM